MGGRRAMILPFSSRTSSYDDSRRDTASRRSNRNTLTQGTLSDWIHGRLGGSKAMLIGALPMTFAFSSAASAWSVSTSTPRNVGTGVRFR